MASEMRRGKGKRSVFNVTDRSHFYPRYRLHGHIPPNILTLWGMAVLRRVVFMSRSIGAAGLSTVSLAHILGAAERNNRQAEVTAGLVLHGDRIVEAMEGPAHAVAKAMERIHADPRHTDVEVILDRPVTRRALNEPMSVCDDAEAFLRAVGLPSLALMTGEIAEDVLERRLAA